MLYHNCFKKDISLFGQACKTLIYNILIIDFSSVIFGANIAILYRKLDRMPRTLERLSATHDES